MTDIITVKDLSRTFRVPVRKEGFKEAVKSIFRRKYETKTAVEDVSFSVKEGEILGLLGPNGAGKSTAIKMMTGILKPTSGEISVLGYHPFDQREDYVRHIGALFGQKSQLWWDIPAADSFDLSRHLYDLDQEEFARRKEDLIERLGIRDVVTKPVRNLSLGERMKCEFVMAMLHKPKIVFLDEPTIGLDVFAKHAIRKFIKDVNKELGTTFILTTHDMDDIEHLANKVIVIAHGKKVFDDSISVLKQVMGKKKNVRLVTENEIEDLESNGIEGWMRLSDFEAHFVLDRDQLSIQELVSAITANNSIMDLEISDPEVEDVIKEIYTRE